MFKYLILILFSISINGDFIKSVPLEDVKFIKFIKISFSDNQRNTQKQFINISKTFLENEIIFSEARQDTFLGSFILKNPLSVSSLKIRYLNSNGTNRNKIVYVDKGSISSKQLYFYEKKDYLYSQNDVISNNKKDYSYKQNDVISNNKKDYSHKRDNAVSDKKSNLIFENNLPITYNDKNTFIDISFQKCNDCDDIRFKYWDKRVIFYFTFETRNDKKMNLSQNIKRIQIVNKINDKYPTWVIVEAKENIVKIKKLYSKSDKNIMYRIYID